MIFTLRLLVMAHETEKSVVFRVLITGGTVNGREERMLVRFVLKFTQFSQEDVDFRYGKICELLKEVI